MAQLRDDTIRTPTGQVLPNVQALIDWVRETAVSERTAPLLSALREKEAADAPRVQRQAFLPWAERGMGASGAMAEDVKFQLGDFAREMQSQRDAVISQARRDVIAEQADWLQNYWRMREAGLV